MIAEYHSAIEVLTEFDKYFESRVVLGNRHDNVLWVNDAGSIPTD